MAPACQVWLPSASHSINSTISRSCSTFPYESVNGVEGDFSQHERLHDFARKPEFTLIEPSHNLFDEMPVVRGCLLASCWTYSPRSWVNAITLRPLAAQDFDGVFAVASDPGDLGPAPGSGARHARGLSIVLRRCL